MSDPIRLSPTKFIERVENASSYAIVMNERLEEIELLVKGDDGEIQGYLGPDPEKTSPRKLSKFMKRLETIVDQDKAEGITGASLN